MSTWLEKGWYGKHKFTYLLFPLTVLFWFLSSLRRLLFRLGVLQSAPSAVPVIVVGNISVGGTGKTPFSVYLVDLLRKHGLKPAIVSRGYGAEQSAGFPRSVDNETPVKLAGDEPKLLAYKANCPVVIAPKRAEAVRFAAEQFDIDVVVSDDGLQHYEMGRALEVVLVDGDRKHGNGWLLPVGPLREPISRLDSVDLVVENNGFKDKGEYRLSAGAIYNLASPERKLNVADVKSVHLVSGIGNPNRFVDTVRGLALEIQSETWFPDHHPFSQEDFQRFNQIPENEVILMTEKDAVKCADFAQNNWFVLPIAANVSDALEQRLMQLIDSKIK